MIIVDFEYFLIFYSTRLFFSYNTKHKKTVNKILFLDESGDHNLAIIDPKHPIFVLVGVVADRDYAIEEMTNRLNLFKKNLFGTTQITLHTADFTRQKNGFERMKEERFCEKFYEELNQLISELDITIIACAIKKEQHMSRYGIDAINPYHLSLRILIERFCFELNNGSATGQIIAEGRDATLNHQLKLAWSDLKISGTHFKQASEINNKINSLTIKKKDDGFAGLEIADAIVTPIARRILGRKSRIDINVIKQKMRKDHLGRISGYGLVVLPKK
jgi:hypothetical protein